VTIVPGESQAYSVTGEDTYGNVIGTITTAKFAISQPGDISWTAGAYNVANPAAPVASSDVEYSWLCQLSTNPCPPAAGTSTPDGTSLSYVVDQVQIDTFTITLSVAPATDNYAEPVYTSVSFTTTNGGG
jgi:hypothetical protein